jgi:hypothetical protein
MLISSLKSIHKFGSTRYQYCMEKWIWASWLQLAKNLTFFLHHLFGSYLIHNKGVDGESFVFGKF